MKTRDPSHPTPDVLRALGTGKLDEAAVEPVLAHLETCHDCQTQLSGLSGDSVVARLRAAHGRGASAPAAKPARVPTKVEIAADAILPELRNHPQYEVLRELGRGGMGVVYLAKNKLMEREEVLKVVNKQLLGQDGAAERFLREIRSAAKLNHPNIVTAYTTLQVGDLLVLAMEYIEGDDLAKVVKTRGPLPVANACFYMHQAALGLQHASGRGMIHRDIKPGNLILAREGKKHIVKILDFGLAKATREEGTSHDLTGDNKMLGTPDYIAPEQAMDATRADIRADIYSLGCALHFLLTGRVPFQAHSLYQLLHMHMSINATPVHELRPDVPAALSAVVAKMMAKDPARRYQTPADVAKALAPFVKGSVKALPAPRAGSVFDPRTTMTDADAKTGSRTATLIPAARQDTMMEKPAPLVQLSPHVAAGRPSGTLGGRKLLIGAGIGVGVLLILVLGIALVAGTVFMLRTKDGTILVENLQREDIVLVDGEKVILKLKGDGKPIEIQKAPGKHELVVKRDGFKIQVKQVILAAGRREEIKLRWERDFQAGKAGPGEHAPPLPLDALIREMTFVRVRNGTFWMGWGSGWQESLQLTLPSESAQMTIPLDFELAAYTVTQEQWEAVMGSNPSWFSRNGKGRKSVQNVFESDLRRFPVESVSWDDVQVFLEKLNALNNGKTWKYRLPKEAEWEYACRNAVPDIEECSFDFYFATGTNDLSSKEANFDGERPAGKGMAWQCLKRPTRVGQYVPNKLGLYDMHGNVGQWCEHRWTPMDSARVFRGGSWLDAGAYCRAAYRSSGTASSRYSNVGLRLARVPSGGKE